MHECEELLSVVVRASDLQHLLDVYIENGMVEAEDEDIVNRLWKALKDLTKVAPDPQPCSWSGKRMASPSGHREKCPGCGQMVASVSGYMGPEFENHRMPSTASQPPDGTGRVDGTH